MSRLLLLLALVAAGPFAVACAEESPAPADIPGAARWVDDPFSGGYPTYEDEATGLWVVFGTPDLGVGASRVSFALFDYEGIINAPLLFVATRFYPDGAGGQPREGEEAALGFRRFPEGGRGIYTGLLTFEQPGLWAIEAIVPRTDGTVSTLLFPVEVAREPSAPAVGAPAPRSVHRTAADVATLAELTTASDPDPRLHTTTIAAALDAGRPFVVTFASPAFCTNALCGPQVEVLSELADEHAPRADFIHVDLYENPHEIRGDLAVARRAATLAEWGIHTDEWTFVVDGAGIVRARFEGFAPRDEVESALQAVLRE